MHKIRIIKL